MQCPLSAPDATVFGGRTKAETSCYLRTVRSFALPQTRSLDPVAKRQGQVP